MATGAIIGGSAVVGLGSALLSSKAQSSAAGKAADAAKDAAEVQAAALLKMYDTTRADFMPYMEIGKQALYELSGYNPVTKEVTTPKTSSVTSNPVSQPSGTTNYPNPFNDPTGSFGSPLGGFGASYGDSNWDSWVPGSPYPGMPTNVGLNVPVGGPAVTSVAPAQPQTETTYEKTGPGIDPTGGAQKYMDALEALTFELDPTDEIYKWRQDEGEKAINSALAARGLHDSSYAVNRIGEFNRALTADEVERQYNQNYLRKYGQTVDLFNMANKLGSTTYNKYLDLVKIGTGAANSAGNASTATGQQLSSVYGNLGANLSNSYANQGAAEGAFWSGVGGAGQNALAAYGYGKNLGLWGNQGTASTPNNYLTQRQMQLGV